MITQLDLVQAWLTHFAYKPGVKIIPRLEDKLVHLLVKMTSDDSNGGEPRTVAGHYVVPEFISTAGEFYLFLREALFSFERHEVLEWFKVDGAAIFDPHAEKPRGVKTLRKATPNGDYL